MREILFRGKRLDNGEWVEGFYCKHDTVKVCFTTDDPKTKHLIVMDGFCDWGFEPPLQGVEVAPGTVGQFTGLLDKNGKRIFEGDILSLRASRAHEVKFDAGGFFMEGTAIPFKLAGKFEIIGNIHDNPEFLRGE